MSELILKENFYLETTMPLIFVTNGKEMKSYTSKLLEICQTQPRKALGMKNLDSRFLVFVLASLLLSINHGRVQRSAELKLSAYNSLISSNELFIP